MTNLVPSEDIERIVGTVRHRHAHYARAISSEQTVYILHSHECLEAMIDLRDCPFSVALDRGIQMDHWDGHENVPVAVAIWSGRLIPLPPRRARRIRPRQATGMNGHDHDDSHPCSQNCFVGPARIHLNTDGCNHTSNNVCLACADLTDAETAAIREYFTLLDKRRPTA